MLNDIVQCAWCDTFTEVLEKLDPQLASVSVEKVVLCSNEQFRDPVHVAPLNAPVELCKSYGFNVCYHLEDGEPVEQDGRPTRNAFQILMSSHTQRILPGRIEGDSLRGDQRLRNAVIDVLEEAQIGWSPQMVSSAGSACVSQITSALWYLDAHHDTLRERSLHLPTEFVPLCGFNDWQKKKVKKPQLSAQGLDGHVQSLSRMLSLPWLGRAEYRKLRSLVESLNEVMHRYKEYLVLQNQKQKESSKQLEPVRSIGDSLEVRTLPASDAPVKQCYLPLSDRLSSKGFYEEVSLDDFAPDDRYTRRHWMDKLSFPY